MSFGNSLGSLLNDLANNGQLRGPLGQTDDLDAEIVARMLAIDSSFATAFDEEQLLALPDGSLRRIARGDSPAGRRARPPSVRAQGSGRGSIRATRVSRRLPICRIPGVLPCRQFSLSA